MPNHRWAHNPCSVEEVRSTGKDQFICPLHISNVKGTTMVFIKCGMTICGHVVLSFQECFFCFAYPRKMTIILPFFQQRGCRKKEKGGQGSNPLNRLVESGGKANLIRAEMHLKLIDVMSREMVCLNDDGAFLGKCDVPSDIAQLGNPHGGLFDQLG